MRLGGAERWHCPPKTSLTLAGSLLVPLEALIGGGGCRTPGWHVLIRAMQVQREAGQQAWGQEGQGAAR